MWRLWINSKIHRTTKSKKINKFCQKLLEQQNMKFIKKVYLREKEAYSLDYCANDNFPGTFAEFRLKIFTQEKICSYGDPCL